MLLQRAGGAAFATGALRYDYRPATEHETTPRITVEILIAGIRLSAFVDTGGVYFICPPNVALALDLQPRESVGEDRLMVRGLAVTGALYRIPLTFRATEGENITIDATAFVPLAPTIEWDDFPCILGMQGCLERLCFAVDPMNEIFYFGESS